MQESLLVVGQGLKSLLWRRAGSLGDAAELIELFYGVSFNGLRIHRAVRRKSDRSIGYILFWPYADSRDRLRDDASITMTFNCEREWCLFTKFNESYETVT